MRCSTTVGVGNSKVRPHKRHLLGMHLSIRYTCRAIELIQSAKNASRAVVRTCAGDSSKSYFVGNDRVMVKASYHGTVIGSHIIKTTTDELQ